jgi:D-alanyl-D-alanine-carboxypeptidase/D-alanyl-D-alanine-endopeptidase
MYAALTLLFVPLAATPPVEAPKPLDAIVRRHGEAFVADKPHLAVVIGVTTPQEQRVWGFGTIEREGRRTVPNGRTLYEIGSITKTMTGTLLADLVCNEQLQLDDRVQNELPSDWTMPRHHGRDISFLHLATHTSSLPRMPPGFQPFLVLTGTVNDPYAAYREENLRLSLSQIELSRPIGSRFEYSNLAMGLLGIALARAASEPDAQSLFQNRLLTPLGLDDTTFTPRDDQLARLAPPFKNDGSAGHSWHFDCLRTCGGLRSTADDLLRYAEAAMGRIDSPLRPAFDLATEAWQQTCEGERAIGLGWFVQPIPLPRGFAAPRQGRLLWHGGATGGYRAFLGVIPEAGCAVVVLSNSTLAVDPTLTWPVIHAVLREQAGRRAAADRAR